MAGSIVLGFAIYILVSGMTKLPELEQSLYIAYALLIAGGFIAAVTLIGCCGAVKESKCLLIMVRKPENS